MNPQQPNFTTQKIARSFFLLALLTLSMVGTVAYVRGRKALQQAAFSRLTITATLKEKEISRWLSSCEEDFLLIADSPTVRQDVQTLLSSPPASSAYRAAEQRLSAYFAEVSQKKPKFTEISIQNRANQIIFSTNPALKGKYEISTNLTELQKVVPSEYFSPIFYVSPDDGKPAITYSTEVYDAAGDRQGLILANLNLKRIDDIISERTGLDKTDETYLVGSLANKTAFISRENSSLALPDGPHSKGIDAAFRGENGAGLYNNYSNRRVLGVYRWLSGQDVALLAEIGEAEAFAPARRLATAIMLVGLGATGVLSLGVSRLAHQLSESRKQIDRYSDQLEKTAAAANAANRTKSEFLANMSHELRTPLNVMLGFTQLMQRDSDRFSPQNEYLGIISRSGEHLLNLINDVLSMAKIEAGRTTFDSVDFDLRYLLLTLEEMLRMKAEAKSLQLFVTVGETVPQFIKTDEMKLRQVLVNLVGNAVKFTQSGSITLTVSIPAATAESEENVDPAAHHILFSVQDTGPGIESSELPHLFDPFYQSSKTHKAHQGTGLGLAISQQFVGLMGGTICVQSKPGQGANFSFGIQALPASADRLQAMPTHEVFKIAPEQPAYRILVVEDIASARQLLVELLSLVGFQVRSVGNGKEAIATYKSWHPDLIWMDIRMPVMDGYEATRRIRAIEAKAKKTNRKINAEPFSPTKIIALSASAFEEERAAVLESGCDDFVRKPFRTYVIFEKMSEHLGVQYIYKNSPLEKSPQNALPELQPEALTVMPPAWLDRFHQAAVQVDAEQLHHLISQIPDEHRQLAAVLSTLTRSFCFDELIALTKTRV